MVDRAGATATLRAIATEFSAKNVTFMAAGIAYNAFVSLAPILVVLLAVVSAVGGGLEGRVVELSRRNLPGPIADIVTEVFQGGAGDPAASVIGVVVLVWGTLKIFRGLDTAFSEIYETSRENSFVDRLVDGAIVFVALVLALAATVGVTAAFAAFEDVVPGIGLVTPLVLLLGLVVAFVPMYYRFPDTDVHWRSILPGAAFAAVGWALFQAVFQVYLAFTGASSGSLFGGVIVVVTWLYFSGLVLLLGAVINAVLGGHATRSAGGVGEGVEKGARRLDETMDRDEFRVYLERLRSSVAGRSEESRRGDERYPNPRGPISVVERTETEDGERRVSISIEWGGAE